MAISFVAAGTTFSATGGSTSLTLNKPAGVADGDILVAVVAFWANGAQKTVSASGWTVRQTAYRDVSSDQIQITVLTRPALAADPSTWAVTVSGTVYLRVAAVSCYRGVQTIGNSGQTNAASATSLATATVNNTIANSWRITCGAYFAGSLSYTISSNEITRRFLVDSDNSGSVQAALWDSNGGIVTGNTSRTVSRSSAWTCAGSVILILNEAAGTPASGTLASTLAPVSASVAGEEHNDGTMAASLSPVAAQMDGYGQPPTVSGTMSASLSPVAASIDAANAAVGSLGAIVNIEASLVGETRVFGVRVINVDAEDRTIKVESRGVAD